MSPASKRLALVGFGRIATKHIEVFRALGCEVVACCNRSEEKRARARAEAGIPSTFGSIPEMLERELPDGVVVCASFDGIAAAASPIVEAGVPVLVEKPPAISIQELDGFIASADEARCPVMVGLNRRHYSVVRRALGDSDEPITMVSVSWSESPIDLAGRFTRDQIGRMIFGNSIHGLDLMTLFGGELEEPGIVAHDLGGFRWLMDLHGTSDRGVLCHFESTWDAPGRWRVEVTRPGRRYVFAPLETCRVFEAGGAERVLEPDEDDRRFKPGFMSQARTFLEVIETRQVPDAVTLRAARPAVKLAESLTHALTGTDFEGVRR